MEVVLGVAPSGTYDDDPAAIYTAAVRRKAIRLAVIKYSLLVRDAQCCNCERCAANRAVQHAEHPHSGGETEP